MRWTRASSAGLSQRMNSPIVSWAALTLWANRSAFESAGLDGDWAAASRTAGTSRRREKTKAAVHRFMARLAYLNRGRGAPVVASRAMSDLTIEVETARSSMAELPPALEAALKEA